MSFTADYYYRVLIDGQMLLATTWVIAVTLLMMGGFPARYRGSLAVHNRDLNFAHSDRMDKLLKLHT
jgi:hypothetical protein